MHIGNIGYMTIFNLKLRKKSYFQSYKRAYRKSGNSTCKKKTNILYFSIGVIFYKLLILWLCSHSVNITVDKNRTKC